MTVTSCKAILFRSRYALLILILLPIFYEIAQAIVNTNRLPNTDFFTYWLAGRLTLSGENPYSSETWIAGHHQYGATWIPNATFIYPLPLSLFFSPFGFLSYYQAKIVWVTFSQLFIFLSLLILLNPYPRLLIKKYFIPLLAGVVLFRSTILSLFVGQLSGFLLFICACIVYLWETGKWWQGSILLPLLAMKPNLGVPIILVLLIYIVFQREGKALIAFAASGLVLLIAGWIQNPIWITEFLKAGNTKLIGTFGFSPTIWGLSSQLCDFQLNCVIGVGGLFSLLFLAGTIKLFIKKSFSPAFVISMAITGTLFLTPYTWPYDQLLLVVPIITVTMQMAKANYRLLYTVAIFLLIDLLTMVLLTISAKINLEIWNAIIPISVYCILVWCMTKDGLISPKPIGNGT